MENNFSNVMDFVNELNKTHGVKQRGGKMYTQVVHRMEAFRRFYGLEYGIDTQVLVDDGQRVVIKAVVTNADGLQLGSGMAEEIRGQGHVNTTSALENCETSAVGRALASIGLAGGEYASANEMDAVGRKTEAIADKKPAPAPAPAPEPVETTEADENKANEFIGLVKKKIKETQSEAKMIAWANTSSVSEQMNWLKKHFPEMGTELSTDVRNHIKSLKKGS